MAPAPGRRYPLPCHPAGPSKAGSISRTRPDSHHPVCAPAEIHADRLDAHPQGAVQIPRTASRYATGQESGRFGLRTPRSRTARTLSPIIGRELLHGDHLHPVHTCDRRDFVLDTDPRHRHCRSGDPQTRKAYGSQARRLSVGDAVPAMAGSVRLKALRRGQQASSGPGPLPAIHSLPAGLPSSDSDLRTNTYPYEGNPAVSAAAARAHYHATRLLEGDLAARGYAARSAAAFSARSPILRISPLNSTPCIGYSEYQ